MKNIQKSIVDKIAHNCHTFYKTYEKSDYWVCKNLKYEEMENLSVKIRKNKAEIHKIEQTIDSKPVFAIFGLSQVGKSYLVQNILSVNGEPLNVIVGNDEINFLSAINPIGNQAESTGVVTRFSIDPSMGNDKYPVKAKVFSAKDIVIILADAFFSDITKLENYTSKEAFKQRIHELQARVSSNAVQHRFFTEDDIWNTAKYFRQNFNKYAQNVKEIEQSGFWREAGKLISKLPVSEWHELFELIWCSDKELTKLFKVLISTLEIISFSDIVYFNQSTILRNEGNVLDVQRLNDLLSTSPQFSIQLPSGEVKELEISKLSAITAEITLVINKKIAEQKSFLMNTDLLDFPGARSREEFSADTIHELIAVKMFLRGKVSFLFNKYSSDFEINNLLFCLKDEKIEVNTISDLLNEWIEKNIGKDESEREKTIGNLPTSPLFIIMTFFNRQLVFDPVNDNLDVSYKWDNRFRRFFEEQITFKYGWHKRWTKSKPNFSNFYFLRDFKYSTDTFSQVNEIEDAIKPERFTHWENLRKSFLENPFVKDHFDDPVLSWDKSATPMNDGSQLILDALVPAANNYVKISNFSKNLEMFKSDMIRDLKKFHQSDNLNDKRKKAFRDATKIEFELLKLFRSPDFKFTDFLNDMSINEVSVYNLIHKNYLDSRRRQEPEHYQIFKKMFPGISGSLSRTENLLLISRKLNLDTIEEAEKYLTDNGIDLDAALENRLMTSASRLVDGILDHWKEQLSIEEFDKYFNMGLDKSAMNLLIENLLETFQSIGVRNELIELFEQKTRLINAPSDTEEYLASLITEYINDFTSNFGFNFMKDERVNEIINVAEALHQDLDLLTGNGKKNEQSVLLSIYDQTDREDSVAPPLIENFQIFIIKMKLAMLSNCGFANYDIQANNELSQLITDLETLDFQIS